MHKKASPLVLIFLAATFLGSLTLVPTAYARSVTQPIRIATPAGGTAFTYAVSGCSVSPTSGTSGSVVDFTATASCVLTVKMPTPGTNTRYVFASSASSTTVTTCASGTCSTFSPADYYQLSNTFRATPLARTTWDAAYSIGVTGTVAGTAGTAICTISTASGGGSATCSGWMDYNTAVSVPQTLSGAPANTRWYAPTISSAAQTTGGNTITFNYYNQLSNTFQISTVGIGPPTWDSGLSLAVTGTYLGTASSTICSISPTSGSATAASCTGYSDYNTAVTFAQFLSGAGANIRWQNAAGAASSTAALTTGGSTYNANYYKQLSNTYSASPVSPTTFSASITFTISGTSLGTGITLCAVSLPATPAAGAYSCVAYADYNTAINFPTLSGANPANIQWHSEGTASFSYTTGGNTATVNYVEQLSNTYSASPFSPTTFSGSISFTITGTYAGTTGSTICTISVPATPAASTAYSCTAFADYNTAINFPATSGANPVNVQWHSEGTTSFTYTTGGNTATVNYVEQLYNTFSASPQNPTTFSPSITFPITGTSAGVSTTICTIAVPSSPAASTSYSCAGYSDYDTPATFPPYSMNNPPGVVWDANGTLSYTFTTGGNTETLPYYDSPNDPTLLLVFVILLVLGLVLLAAGMNRHHW